MTAPPAKPEGEDIEPIQGGAAKDVDDRGTRIVVEDVDKLPTSRPYRLNREPSAEEPRARTILVGAMVTILVLDILGLLGLSLWLRAPSEVIAAYSSASAPFLTLATAAITYYFTHRP